LNTQGIQNVNKNIIGFTLNSCLGQKGVKEVDGFSHARICHTKASKTPHRRMAVLNPVKLILGNYPIGHEGYPDAI